MTDNPVTTVAEHGLRVAPPGSRVRLPRTAPPVVVRVSGKAMSTIEGSEIHLDPVKYDGGTQGARDAYEGLQSAQGRRAGRGWTYEVTTSPEGARTLEGYCRTVGETFVGERDPETRADGRALLAVADRIRGILQELA